MARKKKAEEEDKKKGQQAAQAKSELGLTMRYLVISGKDHMQVSRSADGVLEDISLSGLVFQTPAIRQDDLHLSYDESPLIRNRLTLEIDLPGGRKFTAIGEVSWYERSFVSQDAKYHVGVSFTEIASEDREALKTYLVSKQKMAKAIALDV